MFTPQSVQPRKRHHTLHSIAQHWLLSLPKSHETFETFPTLGPTGSQKHKKLRAATFLEFQARLKPKGLGTLVWSLPPMGCWAGAFPTSASSRCLKVSTSSPQCRGQSHKLHSNSNKKQWQQEMSAFALQTIHEPRLLNKIQMWASKVGSCSAGHGGCAAHPWSNPGFAGAAALKAHRIHVRDSLFQ